jgi:hypothetical protein
MAATRRRAKKAKAEGPRYRLEIEAPVNGRVHKATVTARDAEGRICYTDRADLTDARERKKLAARMAAALGADEEALASDLEKAWHENVDRLRREREQARAGSAEAVVTVELLDAQPEEIHRPLTLVAGHAYAAAWCKRKTSVSKSVDGATGAVTVHDPPLVTVEDCQLVIRDDGRAFADADVLPGVRPLAELGLPVRLPSPLPPGKGWSGAGVKRYLAGERPDPEDVFDRLVTATDRFLDFSRSLDDQRTMCELIGCYGLATYLLDALNVIGYVWPNGEPGSGKTTLLHVVVGYAYLGQVILAGSTYPTLRDLADYGATLGFDDAEAVMDAKRTDPDKRTLLLAGNRRGATIAFKEQVGDRWQTRYVSTFCPRMFSAIRLPDPVLGSRTIVVPLVRSGDEAKTKADPADDSCWPCDRRRLVDDLWALGLANLRYLAEHDREAACRARLSGRALEPWRAILAVAHWLEYRHDVAGLFERLEGLSVAYQRERADHEENDMTRVLYRVLLGLVRGRSPGETVGLVPGDLAKSMCALASADDLVSAENLADPGKPYTTARKVGWLLRRQRFRRGERSERAKKWSATVAEILAGARAYGVEAEVEAPSPSPADGNPETF